jgi:hypothetical protein
MGETAYFLCSNNKFKGRFLALERSLEIFKTKFK